MIAPKIKITKNKPSQKYIKFNFKCSKYLLYILSIMSLKYDIEVLIKEKEIQESLDRDYSFVGLADQSESEIQWVKLHQMFDR